MPKAFQDHFSRHAARYAEFRPAYPQALIEYLVDCCPRHDLAWDCATGNGQAAVALCRHFERVVATDASATQLRAATVHAAIDYRHASAEVSGLADRSVDLITVAQALHWFDIPRFFEEAARVLAAGGVLACWCYERCHVNPQCDLLIERVFTEVEPYWPPERQLVDNRYRDIRMPLAPLQTPRFEMQADWTADQALGYFRTWSASQRYLESQQADPAGGVQAELYDAWGPGRRTVTWPITLKASVKDGSD